MVITKCYQALPLEGGRYFCLGVRKHIFVRNAVQSSVAAVGANAQSLHPMESPISIG